MPEASNDELIAGMTTESGQRLAAFGGLLRGVGADVVAEYHNFVKTLEALPGIGQSTASRIATLRADDSLPLEHRRRLEHETRDATDIVLRKTPAAAHQSIPKIRSMLEDGLLPSSARVEPGVRTLRRQELQVAMNAQPSGTPLDRARRVIGTNPHWDSELLSDYGRALVGDDWKALRAEAVGRWKARLDGTEKQLNSRKALVGLEDANLPGAVAAHVQAARAHLTRDDRLPPRRQP
jgi:hypothetical protein